ncbi:DUF3990 domain-containing protein [Lachnospiraceae bacterium YH-ros2226]
MILYHGNDHVLAKPLFGFGKQDNDYGSGFYTTQDFQQAVAWAMSYSSTVAYVNAYEIDETKLNVVNLDQYGPLSWIAEIVANRGARGERAMLLGRELSNQYRADLSKADIVVGYRADDSYSDIVDAFLQNEINVDEMDRLFREGHFGLQYFIKSQKAFDALEYRGYQKFGISEGYQNQAEVKARMDVSRFLRNRSSQIVLNGFRPSGITAQEAVKTHFVYDPIYKYYAPEIKGEVGSKEEDKETSEEERER